MKSIDRVKSAAQAHDLQIQVKQFDQSTRTASDAARECGCDISQIVKSLVFQGTDTNRLFLFLVSGSNKLDLGKASRISGESVERADPDAVRKRTGFAIGGVAPIGSMEDMTVYMDPSLLEHETVWAAAGSPNAVFAIKPDVLASVAVANVADICGSNP